VVERGPSIGEMRKGKLRKTMEEGEVWGGHKVGLGFQDQRMMARDLLLMSTQED